MAQFDEVLESTDVAKELVASQRNISEGLPEWSDMPCIVITGGEYKVLKAAAMRLVQKSGFRSWVIEPTFSDTDICRLLENKELDKDSEHKLLVFSGKTRKFSPGPTGHYELAMHYWQPKTDRLNTSLIIIHDDTSNNKLFLPLRNSRYVLHPDVSVYFDVLFDIDQKVIYKIFKEG